MTQKNRLSPPTLSLRAYARHRAARSLPGRTLAAVQKAIESGRIEADTDGRIEPALADRQWRKNTIPRDDALAAAPPRDPALPLYAASCALVDLAVKIEECLEGARNETASRNPTAASVKVWRALYKTWGEMVPALETMQRECRRAAS
jgi:hypothetical protein